MNFMKEETDNTADFTFYCTKDISHPRGIEPRSERKKIQIFRGAREQENPFKKLVQN